MREEHRFVPPRNGRRTAGVLLIAAGVGYSAWLVEFVLPTGLSAWTSDVSDHLVDGQPYRQVFRATDVIAGVLMTLAVAAGWRATRPRRAARAGLIAVGLLGVATVVDALCTPDCVATVDAACRRRERAGQVSVHHLVHLGSSTVAGVSMVAAGLVLVRIARSSGRRWWGYWAWALFAAVVSGQVLSIVFYAAGGGGGAQRVQLLGVGIGFIAAGVIRTRERAR
jgi:hypothetical protein